MQCGTRETGRERQRAARRQGQRSDAQIAQQARQGKATIAVVGAQFAGLALRDELRAPILQRRFVAIDGSPKYLAVYDLESPEVMQSEAYLKVSEQSPWTRRIHEHLTTVQRNVYVEITPEPKAAPKRE